ncbi:MAG: hypothetical protein ACOX3I_04325 [Limnochordia bacterium]
MLENYSQAFRRIEAWWHGDMIDRACIAFSVPKPGLEAQLDTIGLNRFWPSEDEEPLLEELVDEFARLIDSRMYFGEAIPTIPHLYGARGTPMTIGAYLGGKVLFKPETVWIEPIIDDWDTFEVLFDPENRWWKYSCQLLELSAKKSQGKYLTSMPDYGDALTTFSLLRGNLELVYDIVDSKEKVVRARDQFVALWKKCHQANWDVYRRALPGDTSWLIWAPGKTYAAQCDFSVLLSPSLFEELVVPELEMLGEYVDYIVWHLDGPDEIKYLDRLLEIPEIKAIQWVPGAGKPTAVHWLDLLKRVQKAGKSLYVYAENETEVETLLRELSPRGLFISGGFTGKSVEEAEALIKTVERLSV